MRFHVCEMLRSPSSLSLPPLRNGCSLVGTKTRRAYIGYAAGGRERERVVRGARIVTTRPNPRGNGISPPIYIRNQLELRRLVRDAREHTSTLQSRQECKVALRARARAFRSVFIKLLGSPNRFFRRRAVGCGVFFLFFIPALSLSLQPLS